MRHILVVPPFLVVSFVSPRVRAVRVRTSRRALRRALRWPACPRVPPVVWQRAVYVVRCAAPCRPGPAVASRPRARSRPGVPPAAVSVSSRCAPPRFRPVLRPPSGSASPSPWPRGRCRPVVALRPRAAVVRSAPAGLPPVGVGRVVVRLGFAGGVPAPLAGLLFLLGSRRRGCARARGCSPAPSSVGCRGSRLAWSAVRARGRRRAGCASCRLAALRRARAPPLSRPFPALSPLLRAWSSGGSAGFARVAGARGALCPRAPLWPSRAPVRGVGLRSSCVRSASAPSSAVACPRVLPRVPRSAVRARFWVRRLRRSGPASSVSCARWVPSRRLLALPPAPGPAVAVLPVLRVGALDLGPVPGVRWRLPRCDRRRVPRWARCRPARRAPAPRPVRADVPCTGPCHVGAAGATSFPRAAAAPRGAPSPTVPVPSACSCADVATFTSPVLRLLSADRLRVCRSRTGSLPTSTCVTLSGCAGDPPVLVRAVATRGQRPSSRARRPCGRSDAAARSRSAARSRVRPDLPVRSAVPCGSLRLTVAPRRRRLRAVAFAPPGATRAVGTVPTLSGLSLPVVTAPRCSRAERRRASHGLAPCRQLLTVTRTTISSHDPGRRVHGAGAAPACRCAATVVPGGATSASPPVRRIR